MVTIKKISRFKVWKLIEFSYEDDVELFEKFHVAKMDHSACVMCTIDMLERVAKEKELTYYKVLFNKQPIGYMITFTDFLYSYAINIKFRKKDILLGWWESVKKVLGNQFATGLYENNTRAIDFLKKQGMIIAGKEKDILVLINTL